MDTQNLSLEADLEEWGILNMSREDLQNEVRTLRAARRQSVSEGEITLPELPAKGAAGYMRVNHVEHQHYSADQVREYTRAAIAADRRARQGEPVAYVRECDIDGTMPGRTVVAAKAPGEEWEVPLYRAATKAAVPDDAPIEKLARKLAEHYPRQIAALFIDDQPVGRELIDACRAAPVPATVQQDKSVRLAGAPAGQHDATYGETLDEKALNALLWFYRRMVNSYGRLPFAEEAITGLRERTTRAQRTTIDNAPELLRVGGLMANVLFNFAQKAGRTLDSDDCALFDKLRKEWDVSGRAPATGTPAGGEVEEKQAAALRSDLLTLQSFVNDLDDGSASKAFYNVRGAVIEYLHATAPSHPSEAKAGEDA